MSYQVIINVVEFEDDGVTKFLVVDNSKPGARMWPDAPNEGPFDTRAEADVAAAAFRAYVKRKTGGVDGDGSLAG